jgi:hypothetical protein
MVIDGNVNFLVAKSRDDGRIEGILGFLPCSRDTEKLDIWGVVWKTIPEAMPMLGMEMKKRIITITGARTDLGVGANPSTSVPLLRRIYHYYTAKMKHYYRLSDREEYKIACVTDKVIGEKCHSDEMEVVSLKEAAELENFYDFNKDQDSIPYKDFWYYDRRFYRHPIYKYSVWGLKEANKRAVLVTRVQECNGQSVVRIVDFRGEQSLFGYCGDFFDLLLEKNEYIDFYFDGFEEKYAVQAGMTLCDEKDKNVIPDYFNPFEQSNVDIHVVSSERNEKCLFFKADGDQDRPN